MEYSQKKTDNENMITTEKQSSKIDKIKMYINIDPKHAFQVFYVSLILLIFVLSIGIYSVNHIQDYGIEIIFFVIIIMIFLASIADRWISREIILDSKLFISYSTKEESEGYKKILLTKIKDRNLLIYLGLLFLAIIINIGLLLATNKLSIYQLDVAIIIVFCITQYVTFKEVSRIKRNMEIIISRSGAIVYGQLIVWYERGEFAWLREVTFIPSENSIKANLIINIAWFTRVGNVSKKLTIPVLKEQEELMPNIVSILDEVKKNNKYRKYDDLNR